MDNQFLAKTPLFQGTSPEEIQSMLKCLGARQRSFKKGQLIYRSGEQVHSMGLVLSGSVIIESDDLWGNKSILSHIGPGQIFAETYACLPHEPLMVSVAADQATEALFLDMNQVLKTCSVSCVYHQRLIRNLLSATAQKNLVLSQRILHTAPKTIRGRLTSFLDSQAARQNSRQVTIPFSRQQLADYLNVDRSALSNELSKMQRDGLLEVRKNTFLLKNNSEDDYGTH